MTTKSSGTNKIPPDIKKMDFESALKELESIVNGFENGQLALEESIQAYSRGADLEKHCKNKLSEAKIKVENITSANSNIDT